MNHYATCSRRFGRFHIDADLVMDMHPAVTRIMGLCTILRAEHNLASNAVEYQALCFKFKPIARGTIMPEYQWVFHEDGSVEAETVPVWGVASPLQAPASGGDHARAKFESRISTIYPTLPLLQVESGPLAGEYVDPIAGSAWVGWRLRTVGDIGGS